MRAFASQLEDVNNEKQLTNILFSFYEENPEDAFNELVKNGDFELAKKLILHTKFQSKDMFEGLFEFVCSEGNLDAAKFLTQFGVQISEHNDTLVAVCENNHLDVAKWLLGLSSFFKEQLSMSFCAACRRGNLDVTKWLAEVGTDINSMKDDCFKIACESGNLELVRWLLGFSPVVDIQCLYFLTNSFNEDIGDLLLSAGTDINADNGRVLIYACSMGATEMVRWLISNGADIHIREDTPFVQACINGHIELAQILFLLGSNVNTQDSKAFSEAYDLDNLDMLKWLYSVGSEVRIKPERFHIWNEQKLAIAKWLYSLGFDTVVDKEREFVRACRKRNLSVCKWLYEIGTIINHRDLRNAGFGTREELIECLDSEEQTE